MAERTGATVKEVFKNIKLDAVCDFLCLSTEACNDSTRLHGSADERKLGTALQDVPLIGPIKATENVIENEYQ